MEHPLTAFRKRTSTKLRDIAEQLGVQPPAVLKWEARGVPAERVLDLEKVTGISRHDLRPDLYPVEEQAR